MLRSYLRFIAILAAVLFASLPVSSAPDLGLGVLAPAPTHEAPAPPVTASPSNVLKTWAGYYDVPTLPALRVARNDIITTVTGKLRDEPGTFAQIRTANPDAQIIIYRLSAKGQTWYPHWSTLNANESWFLHNPDVSPGTSATRVRRYYSASGSNVRYAMDLRRPAFRTYEINLLKTLITQWGVSGVYEDGTTGIHRLGYWIVWPTELQRDLWRADNPGSPFLLFLTELRAALPQGFILTNTTIQSPESARYVSDALYLDQVTGTLMEGAYHNPWDAAIKLHPEWKIDFQMAMIRRNLTLQKVFVAYAGVAGSNSTEINRIFNFVFPLYLLQADGAYLHFGWRESSNSVLSDSRYAYMKTVTDDLRGPSGPYRVLADGTLRRDFAGGYVRVNKSWVTKGGMGPQTGQIVTY